MKILISGAGIAGPSLAFWLRQRLSADDRRARATPAHWRIHHRLLGHRVRRRGSHIDRVSQIRMERWTDGRVALVGDAAFCVSLLGGQGSALAMTAAYVLAGELKRANGDHAVAFARYQERLGAFIAGKQRAAVKLSTFFAPTSRFRLFLRNQITKLMGIPFVTELAVGRQLSDRIELPEY